MASEQKQTQGDLILVDKIILMRIWCVNLIPKQLVARDKIKSRFRQWKTLISLCTPLKLLNYHIIKMKRKLSNITN